MALPKSFNFRTWLEGEPRLQALYSEWEQHNPAPVFVPAEESQPVTPPRLVPLQPIGRDRLVFKTTLTVEEMRAVAMNHDHVFILRDFSFNIETGECSVEFVPGNGMCIVQDPLNFP